MENVITVQVELSAAQAWALAQLVKRLGYTDCRALAQNEDETWLMMLAAAALRRALAEAGYAPR